MDENKDSRNSGTQLSSLMELENKLNRAHENDFHEIKLLLEKLARARHVLETQRSQTLETIENFWINAISCHTKLNRLISRPSYVADLFTCFTKLDVIDYGSRYEIQFFFRENPFFTNEVLIKSYCYSSDGDSQHVSTNSEIQWKNPKFRELVSSCTDDIVDVTYPNFFAWYLDNFHPDVDEYGYMIKKDFWPNATSYYLRSQNKREDSCDTENESDVGKSDFSPSFSAFEEIDYGQYDADVRMSSTDED